MLKRFSLLLLIASSAQAATTSPNMSLLIPAVGDTDYPTSITNSFTLMDAHDHSTGKGVLINAAGLASNAVTTAKILDSNVTTNKIADLNVTTGKIADSAVTLAKLDTAALYAIMPAGAIMAYGGTSAPTGWFLCDGNTVSRVTYAALYAAIGDAFGNGNGSSTFHLPDLRGRFLRGRDGGVARDPDRASRTAMNSGGNTADNVGSVQGEAFKAHTHAFTDNATSVAGGITTNTGAGFIEGPAVIADVTDNTGGNETRPINAFVNYIIKY